MTQKVYALVASGGNVLNLVEWDGVTPYSVTPNTLVDATGQPNAQIGGTYNGSVFTAPAAPAAPQGIIFLNSPVTGATLNLPNAPQPQSKLYAILQPAATLASLTFAMGAAPVDGDTLYLYCTKAVTAISFTAPAGVALNAMPTALVALQLVTIIYSAQYNAWFHLQG